MGTIDLTNGHHSVLQPGALKPIDRAITALDSDTTLRDDVEFARDDLLAELELVALLQAEARLVIEGDQQAAARFEALLDRIATETEKEPSVIPSEAEGSGRGGSVSNPPPDPSTTLGITPDDSFVQLDELMAASVAVGLLPVDSRRFEFLFGGLISLAGAVYELEQLRDAALLFLSHGNPQPMRTLSWRPKPRPKKKPKPKPKPKARPAFKSKIKETHSAWMSCFRGAAIRARGESAATPKFTVTSVTPIDACPGEQIMIRGTNFGANGTVAFRAPSGSSSDYLAANADVWSDTLITITVPNFAREGRLRILPIDHVFIACRRKWPVYRLPDSNGPQNDSFLGGLPDIYSLQVNGRDANAWAPPDLDAIMSWVTTSGDLKIDIRNDANPADPHWTTGPLAGGTGSTTWHTKAVSTPTKFIIAVTVTKRCGAVTKELTVFVTVPATLKIEGIEVTQGIQAFTLVGAGPRNTLPTVELKDTIVRVYASSNRSAFNNDLLANCTAALTIGGQQFKPINQAPAGAMSGGNPYLALAGLHAINRESTDSSFNFRIPATLCTGTQTFTVRVWGFDEIGLVLKSESISWTWQKKRAIRMRYVRVAYQGNVPPPNDALFTLQRAFDLLPSPPLDLGAAWLDVWATGQDVSTKDGKQKLLDHLNDAHNCTFSEWLFPWEDDCPDDDGALWIGVVPGNVGGKAKTGGNTSWAASAVTGDRISAAHETGHMLCLCHVNEGCSGNNPDKSKQCGWGPKKYDTLSAEGLVLDVAFDPYYNTTVSSLRYDFMSYACNRWISKTNWNRLFGSI